MKTILVLLLIFVALTSTAQMDWKKTSNWKIYKIPESIIFIVRIDSLNRLRSRPIRQDSLTNYLEMSTILADSINPVWMGGWVATYEYKGQVHKIQISAYGSFSYDQSSGKYYQIPVDLREEWMSYINQILSSL